MSKHARSRSLRRSLSGLRAYRSRKRWGCIAVTVPSIWYGHRRTARRPVASCFGMRRRIRQSVSIRAHSRFAHQKSHVRPDSYRRRIGHRTSDRNRPPVCVRRIRRRRRSLSGKRSMWTKARSFRRRARLCRTIGQWSRSHYGRRRRRRRYRAMTRRRRRRSTTGHRSRRWRSRPRPRRRSPSKGKWSWSARSRSKSTISHGSIKDRCFQRPGR